MSTEPGSPAFNGRSVFMAFSGAVQEMCDVLGLKLVASLSGINDPAQVCQWARGDLKPDAPVQQRLRFAHAVLKAIEDGRGKKSAQAWVTSINPRLGYDSPLKAIREDRFLESAAAAKALLEDAYDG